MRFVWNKLLIVFVIKCFILINIFSLFSQCVGLEVESIWLLSNCESGSGCSGRSGASCASSDVRVLSFADRRFQMSRYYKIADYFLFYNIKNDQAMA